jgi:hypothetical protein
MKGKKMKRLNGNVDQNQQGDVWLERTSKIPGTAKKLKHGKLAEGEATGHHHSPTNLGIAILFMDEERMFLRVKEGETAEVTHQEHGTVRVPAGDWEVGQVFEYDHFEEEARKVLD